MKKTFLTRRNALLTSSDVSWGAFALAFAVLVLISRLFAPNAFWYIFAPAFRAADALNAEGHTLISSFGDTAELTLRNERLAAENAALANENRALLEKTTSLGDRSASAGIIAGVVARPPASPYDTLVLSVGSDDGVVAGMGAFGAGGSPLGVVSSVLPDFSRVTLFSAPGMTTDAWVGRGHLPLTLRGAGGGTVSASAARSAEIAVGDTVFAPGPGALRIGSVVRLDSSSSSPSVAVHIQLAVNMFSIGWVELRATGSAFVESLLWTTPTP